MAETNAKPQLLPFEGGRRPLVTEADRTRPIWEVFADLAEQIPAEELDKLPGDASQNLDHYLYGSPKKAAK